jgi:hypothetical protein
MYYAGTEAILKRKAALSTEVWHLPTKLHGVTSSIKQSLKYFQR